MLNQDEVSKTEIQSAPELLVAPATSRLEGNRVREVRRSLGVMEDYEEAARLFQVFADATRLRLVSALSSSPLCVNELSEVVNLGQSATSHALRILRDRGIVGAIREGQQVRYHLADPEVRVLLAQAWGQALDGEPPEAIVGPESLDEESNGHGKKKKKKKKKKK